MKKRVLMLLGILIGALLLTLLLFPVHGEEALYDNVVRLHVLANSDSEEDQALKLCVRDAVLEVSNAWMQECDTQRQATELLAARTEELRAIAEDVVRAAGRDDEVSISLEREKYPTRSYDGVCFPSGEYTSLRICIGDAEGKNWWCCLFPPLCSATGVSKKDAENAFVEVGLTPDQYKVITESEKPVYRVRFKLLEVIRDWFS